MPANFLRRHRARPPRCPDRSSSSRPSGVEARIAGGGADGVADDLFLDAWLGGLGGADAAPQGAVRQMKRDEHARPARLQARAAARDRRTVRSRDVGSRWPAGPERPADRRWLPGRRSRRHLRPSAASRRLCDPQASSPPRPPDSPRRRGLRTTAGGCGSRCPPPRTAATTPESTASER